MKQKIKKVIKIYTFPICISVVSITIALFGNSLAEILRYDRDAIYAGELWRIITGHLVHLTYTHMILNLAGLILIWLFFGQLLSVTRWILIFMICSLGTSIGLLILNPNLYWYVGLSGVLHGLFIAGGITNIKFRRNESILLLSAITLKLVWEQISGPLPGTSSAAGGNVIVDAHLYGAIFGLSAFAFYKQTTEFQQKPE